MPSPVAPALRDYASRARNPLGDARAEDLGGFGRCRLLRYVPLAEDEGGDEDERREVGAEHQRGLRGPYVRPRQREVLLQSFSPERVGEEARVLAEKELAGVLKGLVRDRQAEDQAFEGQGVEKPEPDGERGAPKERGEEDAERRPGGEDDRAGPQCLEQ